MQRRQFLHSMFASAMAAGSVGGRSEIIKPSGTSLGRSSPEEVPGGREFFYRPSDAWAADFIPYFQDGLFQLFFLLDWRSPATHGEGTPWYRISTRDFVHFEEHGEMLPRGTPSDQDLFVFTGSTLRGLGKHHIFYTGHNPHFPAQGKPEQGVMHAVSDDMNAWQKLPGDTFYAPPGQFESNDWRDPFVFWNEEAKEYWMLLAARLKTGPSRRRGCTALCSSQDLHQWRVRDPFWTPGLYFTHECPDLFRIGEWWYLVFSEFSDLVRTRYRMSRSLAGPWLAPKHDYFDGRAFYAGKTASDGSRRFLFGWDPTRAEKKDYYSWDWGGNLVVHEIAQEADGTLSVHIPKEVNAAWKTDLPFTFSQRLGHGVWKKDHVSVDAPGSFGCVAAADLPPRCKIDFDIEFQKGTHGCGLMLRTSPDLESSYYIRLEPDNHRVVFDSWPRGSGPDHPVISLDGGFMPGLDQWIDLSPGIPTHMTVLIDHTIAVVYVNGKIALSTRMYDLVSGGWGPFVTQGRADFRNITLRGL